MRHFGSSTTRSFNDENINTNNNTNATVSSKFKNTISSRFQPKTQQTQVQPQPPQQPHQNVRSARIGLNERASLQSLDINSQSYGNNNNRHQLLQRPSSSISTTTKPFQIYKDDSSTTATSTTTTTTTTTTSRATTTASRKPLAERLLDENIMSDDDYKKYADNDEELEEDDATIGDLVEMDEDSDIEEDEEDEDEEDDEEGEEGVDIDDEGIYDDEEESDYDDDELLDKYAPMSPRWNHRIHAELERVIVKFSRDEPDEDDEDTNDISMVAEYSNEIFSYMHELETKLSPHPKYMETQDELEWSMRSTLVGWLVQVHQRFNLLPETLFLTINYMDRFLSKRKVSLSRFQLVGAVALFVAAKYEEINCPSIQEIAYMVDHAYSVDDLLKAEKFMIGILEFEMGWPGPMSFLRRTSKADDYDFETRTLAKYFLEITIMDAKFVASPPSWLAAGAHYLSRRLLEKGDWTEAHVYYSGYTESQLRPLADVLINLCRDPINNHNAIYEKYQERRYRRSATFVQEWIASVQK